MCGWAEGPAPGWVHLWLCLPGCWAGEQTWEVLDRPVITCNWFLVPQPTGLQGLLQGSALGRGGPGPGWHLGQPRDRCPQCLDFWDQGLCPEAVSLHLRAITPRGDTQLW